MFVCVCVYVSMQDNQTALIISSEGGHIEVVRQLYLARADIQATDKVTELEHTQPVSVL